MLTTCLMFKMLPHLCKKLHNNTGNNTQYWVMTADAITKKYMSAIE